MQEVARAHGRPVCGGIDEAAITSATPDEAAAQAIDAVRQLDGQGVIVAPGCVIPVKPIALFKMTDEKGIDDKIICVPLHDPGWNQLEELDDLPENLRKEVPHFFSVYKELDDKPVEIDGWYSREEALKVIDEARTRQEELDADRERDAGQGG